MQMRDFKPGQEIWARSNLPIVNVPSLEFGPHIPRGTAGQFMYYRKRARDGGRLVAVAFPYPGQVGSALVYYCYPTQIAEINPQPTGGS